MEPVNRSSAPPPKYEFSGGMAPRCSNRLRANSSYLIGRTPTMAILSMSESVSTFDSANLQQTQELFCVFPGNPQTSRGGNSILLLSARNSPRSGQPGIRRFDRDAIGHAPMRRRQKQGHILSYTLFIPSYQARIHLFCPPETKSAKLDFPANFAWLLLPSRSDNKPAAFSFIPPCAGCADAPLGITRVCRAPGPP
jgi:hypothetical protein